MKLTPMMEQYFEIKRQVPDAIVMYRMGDFYEMFFEDAETAAPLLDLVLTARGRGTENETPMCGVPHHAVDQHIARLVRKGFRVAICEQMEEPSQAKGLVRRDIVRIVTPGTAVEGSLLDRDHCYLTAIVPEGEQLFAAWLDVSTGDFFVRTYSSDAELRDDGARWCPRELIVPRGEEEFAARLRAALPDAAITLVEPSWFDRRRSLDELSRRFGTQSLRGFGLADDDPRIAPAGAALRYAADSHRSALDHIRSLRVDDDGESLVLDAATLENLEIFESRDSSRTRGSLWGVIHACRTPMGTRMLRDWIVRPLRSRDAIFARHDAVDELTRNRSLHSTIVDTLGGIGDLERMMSRVTLRSATPAECLALSRSLAAVATAGGHAGELSSPLHQDVRRRLDPVQELVDDVRASLEDEPSVSVRDGGVIRTGVSGELDQLRELARNSKAVLLRIEEQERARTGISSLKVRYNGVFGYYIEISKSNLSRVPDDYIRKQTLVNAERFITPELKEIEEKILGAEEHSIAIEAELYGQLLTRLAAWGGRVIATARAVAELDVLAGFAAVALKRRYVRPELVPDTCIFVEEGRHPVIETLTTERFITNDTDIQRQKNGVQIVTGPNMGGKSTYLRQVALIVLLNQIGSFVPAKRAKLGTFDRIFTRVGASDNLARGESTFMVEMHETANILHHATDQSLIVLDEVGRGTATFDGLSLAWAIVEYLHDTTGKQAITLFATHYHELTDLARDRDRIENLSVAVKEWNDQIVFLRKVIRGAADKSYGIQVARLAGIPEVVTTRARELLGTLERKEQAVFNESRATSPSGEKSMQLSLFDDRERGALDRLRSLAIDSLSPIEALNVLHQLQSELNSR